MANFSFLKKLIMKSEYIETDLHYRIIVFGTRNVGKTSTIATFKRKDLEKEESQFLEREIFKTHSANLTLDIVEMPSLYKCFPMLNMSIRRTDAFVLMYAVDDQTSFDAMKQLRDEIIQLKGEHVPIVVVANKKDLPEDQKVVCAPSSESLVKQIWRHGYVESTSSSYEDVCEIFKQAVRQMTTLVHLTPILERRRKSESSTATGSTRRPSVLEFFMNLTKRSSV